jgi:hypothetical protein
LAYPSALDELILYTVGVSVKRLLAVITLYQFISYGQACPHSIHNKVDRFLIQTGQPVDQDRLESSRLLPPLRR